jgi:DNA-binding MarR family transcriptional regulator
MLDPVIHQATRLQILASLQRNRELSFNELCRALGLTEGNLGAHAERLIHAGYVETFHALVGIRFEKRYRLTARGQETFRAYREELARILLLDGSP